MSTQSASTGVSGALLGFVPYDTYKLYFHKDNRPIDRQGGNLLSLDGVTNVHQETKIVNILTSLDILGYLVSDETVLLWLFMILTSENKKDESIGSACDGTKSKSADPIGCIERGEVYKHSQSLLDCKKSQNEENAVGWENKQRGRIWDKFLDSVITDGPDNDAAHRLLSSLDQLNCFMLASDGAVEEYKNSPFKPYNNEVSKSEAEHRSGAHDVGTKQQQPIPHTIPHPPRPPTPGPAPRPGPNGPPRPSVPTPPRSPRRRLHIA